MEMIVGVGLFAVGGCIGYFLALRAAPKVEVNATQDVMLREQLEEAKGRLIELEQEMREYTARIARLDTEKSTLGEKLGEQQSYIAKAQEQFQQQFENLAHKIFDEKNTQSKKNLAELLTPLKEDLSGFKKHISDSFGEHAKEQFALKKEIENVVRASNDMRFQTENLSKALKGDVKTQGAWGEVILERILEASGLRRGEDYVPQASGMGLKHPDHGGTQKPDIVIKLPEGKHAIIDAKVSLTSYERFCAEEDEALKKAHLEQFILSVKTHVKGLEERRYQDTAGLDAPDYVLMFMPIEGAYTLAMQSDTELHAHAWDRKIIIVCPSTLFAILKIISSMWKFERQNKNAEAIAERGGRLYDKVVNFVTDMQKIDAALKKAQGSYDDAFDKLSAGRGNILRQAEQMKQLGVKVSKALPPELISDSEDALLDSPKEDAA